MVVSQLHMCDLGGQDALQHVQCCSCQLADPLAFGGGQASQLRYDPLHITSDTIPAVVQALA